MKKVLEEVGKGFIAFANIVTALVFKKVILTRQMIIC